jgi:hypothetical protein
MAVGGRTDRDSGGQNDRLQLAAVGFFTQLALSPMRHDFPFCGNVYEVVESSVVRRHCALPFVANRLTALASPSDSGSHEHKWFWGLPRAIWRERIRHMVGQ